MPKDKGKKMWTPQKIKALRESLGVTQREFAELLDFSMFTVRNWEQGQDVPGRRACRDLERLERESQKPVGAAS